MRREKLMIDLQQIIADLKASELVPVRLSDNPAADDSSFWEFEGTRDEFIATVKSLGAKAVFLIAYEFGADEFVFTRDPDDVNDEDREDDDDADEPRDVQPPLDLIAHAPALLPYKKYVGEHAMISLLARTAEANLQFDAVAHWYEAFLAIHDPIIESLNVSSEERRRLEELAREQAEEEERLAQEREEEKERASVLLELEALPLNREFQRVNTKAALSALLEETLPKAKQVLGTPEFKRRLTTLYERVQLERARKR